MNDFNEPGQSQVRETESEIQGKFDWQLENCARIKNTVVQRFTCVDSKGNVTKKVIIEYND